MVIEDPDALAATKERLSRGERQVHHLRASPPSLTRWRSSAQRQRSVRASPPMKNCCCCSAHWQRQLFSWSG